MQELSQFLTIIVKARHPDESRDLVKRNAFVNVASAGAIWQGRHWIPTFVGMTDVT